MSIMKRLVVLISTVLCTAISVFPVTWPELFEDRSFILLKMTKCINGMGYDYTAKNEYVKLSDFENNGYKVKKVEWQKGINQDRSREYKAYWEGVVDRKNPKRLIIRIEGDYNYWDIVSYDDKTKILVTIDEYDIKRTYNVEFPLSDESYDYIDFLLDL
jgi:hypothetical protein